MEKERQEQDRTMRLLRIFLEHPGGLHFSELWKIVNERGICAKQTLVKNLEEFREQGLIVINELGRYTLGFSESLSQKIIKGCYELTEEAQSFLGILYREYEHADKGQSSLYAQVAVSFIGSRVHLMNLIAWLLFPFFFDMKVRKVWFFCHENALGFFCEKMNDISQQFLGVKLSDLLLNKPVQDMYLRPQLESFALEVRREIEKTTGLIDQLNVKDATKYELKRMLKKPILTSL
jgi:hypothetical protein